LMPDAMHNFDLAVRSGECLDRSPEVALIDVSDQFDNVAALAAATAVEDPF